MRDIACSQPVITDIEYAVASDNQMITLAVSTSHNRSGVAGTDIDRCTGASSLAISNRYGAISHNGTAVTQVDIPAFNNDIASGFAISVCFELAAIHIDGAVAGNRQIAAGGAFSLRTGSNRATFGDIYRTGAVLTGVNGQITGTVDAIIPDDIEAAFDLNFSAVVDVDPVVGIRVVTLIAKINRCVFTDIHTITRDGRTSGDVDSTLVALGSPKVHRTCT